MTIARAHSPRTASRSRQCRRQWRPGLAAALLAALALAAAGGAVATDGDAGDPGSLLRFEGERLFSSLVVKLRASDGVAGDELAATVDLDGDFAILGSQYHDGNGAAYVYERTGPGTWLETELNDFAGNSDDQLANAVAVDGGVAAAGAPNDEAPTTSDLVGSVLLFTRNGLGSWSRGPKRFAPTPTVGGRFGDAVAIDDDTLVVGSPLASDATGSGGAAFVFERDLGGAGNWGHRATLVASDPLFGSFFGIAVAISGDTIIVGAPAANGASIANTGAVYLFERDQFGPDNWGQVAKRTALDPDFDDEYGESVAIDGDTAVVGARGETGDRGAAYVLDRDNGGANAWGETRKVTASVSALFDRFGDSVSVEGDLLVAGAPNASVGTPGAGAAFVFERDRNGPDQWGEAEQVSAPDGAVDDAFGIAVGFSRNRLLVGAWLDGDNGSVSGSAYVFSSQTDLVISKTDGTASAVPGGTLTYTIVATNDGPDDVLDAAVTDLFPAELACDWTCSPTGGAACTAGPVSGDLVDLAALPAGDSAVYTAICAVDPFAFGTLSNTATVAPPLGITETDSADNSATDVDAVVPAADLSIAKTDNSTTQVPGGLVTYTVTVANAGPSPAIDATVEDELLAPLESCQWTCAAGAGANCQPSGAGPIADTVDLAAGAGIVYTVTCRINAAASGTLTNTATVTAPGSVVDPVAANDTAADTSTLLLAADLSITKTDGVTLASPGDMLTYSIVVSNATGPNDVPGAVVRDDFPPSHLAGCLWGCVGTGGAVCSPGQVAGDILDTADLPMGATATYTAVCVVAPGAMGLVSNTATVEMPLGFGDPAPVNNTASDLDTLIEVQADLGISKTDGLTQATPGGSLAYTITVTNAGPHAAFGVGVEDLFSASPELSCAWSCAPSAGAICTLGQVAGDLVDVVSVPAAGSLVYTADCAIDPAASGTLTNVASLTVPAGINDPNPGNHVATDLDTALVPEADLAITKDDGQTRATPGGSVLYEIEASNLAGPSAVAGVTVTDVFPSELSCSWSCDPSGGATCTGFGTGDLVDSVDLPVGGSVLYSVPCFISAQASGTLTNTVTLAGPANLVDPDPSNDSATDSDALDLGADLALAHTSDPAETVVVGGDLDYTLTVTNLGPLTAEQATLEVDLPAGITLEEIQTALAAERRAEVHPGGLGGTLIFYDGFESGDLSRWSDSVGGPGGGGNPPLGCTVTGQNVACNFGDLASGAGATLILSTVVDPGTSGQITSRAEVFSETFDQDSSNNQNDLTVTVETGPVDLVLAISDSPDPVSAGGTLTYSLLVTNDGPAAATGISLSDPLPVEVTVQSASATQGSCSAGGTVNCDLEALGVGGSATVTIVVQVGSEVVGSLTNAASVLAAETDLDLTNNTATETTTVQSSSRQAPPR